MLEDILIISMMCFGVRAITSNDSILGIWKKIVFVGETDELRSQIFDPISECLSCMASFWGALFFFLSGRVDVYIYAIFIIFTIILICLHLVYKDENQILKYLYLVSFLFFMFQVTEFELCLIVVIASCGLNHLICKLVCP